MMIPTSSPLAVSMTLTIVRFEFPLSPLWERTGIVFFSSGFTRGGLVTHNLSSLPGLASLFSYNQLAHDRLVIRRAVEMATFDS
jgi:hypothetical protein